MNKEIAVKDRYNMILGWIHDYPDRKQAIHIKKGYVGYYSKSADLTIDSKGAIYCYGDGLSDLIRNADRS